MRIRGDIGREVARPGAPGVGGCGWWYWLMTIPLLVTGLSGWSWGFAVTMVFCVIQAVHFAWRDSSLTAFSVQVRVAYVILLVLGQWPPLHWILWVQLIGTSVRVLVGYCLLARSLSLLPWNRFEPFSMALLRRTYVSLDGPTCSSRKEDGWVRSGEPKLVQSWGSGA